jgi:hypothetical protein
MAEKGAAVRDHDIERVTVRLFWGESPQQALTDTRRFVAK